MKNLNLFDKKIRNDVIMLAVWTVFFACMLVSGVWSQWIMAFMLMPIMILFIAADIIMYKFLFYDAEGRERFSAEFTSGWNTVIYLIMPICCLTVSGIYALSYIGDKVMPGEDSVVFIFSVISDLCIGFCLISSVIYAVKIFLKCKPSDKVFSYFRGQKSDLIRSAICIIAFLVLGVVNGIDSIFREPNFALVYAFVLIRMLVKQTYRALSEIYDEKQENKGIKYPM